MIRRAAGFARSVERFAQIFRLGDQLLRLVLDVLHFVAQLIVGTSSVVELARKLGRQRPLLIERAHRATERQHHFVEGAFQRVEVVELAAGIDQQPVQRLVFVAAAHFGFVGFVAFGRCLGFRRGGSSRSTCAAIAPAVG